MLIADTLNLLAVLGHVSLITLYIVYIMSFKPEKYFSLWQYK